jgi:hypothetical protein
MTQIEALKHLDVAQVSSAAGHRSLHDWVSATLDMSHQTAGSLIQASRAMALITATALVDGEIGFERSVEETRLNICDATPERIGASRGLDLAGVRKLAARHRRHDIADEAIVAANQHVVLQPNLNETAWTLSGLLAGSEGRIVEKALHHRGDELSDDAGTSVSRGLKTAMALTAICQDSLDGAAVAEGPDRAGEPVVTVTVDLETANGDFGTTGAGVVNGPRVGPNTLFELLCLGRVELNVTADDGTVLGVGPSASAIPPRLKRHVLARDDGCVIEGCRSRYRLQVHHISPRAVDGSHDPENLMTACWFHHHVAIHRLGHRVDPDSPARRRRLLPP